MSAELIHQMYIAYYQRPADPAGLIYWQDQLNANGGGEAGWNAVSLAFANAAESTALYGSQTLGQKISAIYLAAFERAASADEVAFWEASGFNAAQIGFAIVNGAQNDDLRTVDKKVDYAEAFVSTIDPAGTGVGPFAFQYVDPALGRTLMDPITKDSDVSTATVSGQVNSTLPTLNTVNLTSGNDVVTPLANAAEEISAALGGTQPTLNRGDQIDGGSAQDTLNIDMDGNFLLGFGSGGFMRDVEVVNLAATTSSVTPKLFNFTGASGIETINVGGGNAQISVSELTDTGITVNLSGQTTGAFDIGYATGAISGSGSSMTIGVTDVGATDAVTVTSNGITDLNLISYGTSNKLNLGNSVNDYVALTVQGTGALEITSINSSVSGLDASGLGGNFTIDVNVDTSSALVGSGQTISGGTGHDIFELNGSGVAAFTSTGIEELKFDGASGEAVVYATGMAGLNTLTFSGDATNTPNIRGITASALTVNAIYQAGTPDTYIVTADATLTVNLNADPSATTSSDNDFTFRSDTSKAVTINVGQNASAAGTNTIQKASSLDVTVHASGTYGASVNASAATSINISGAGALNATVSGEKTQTLTVDVGSGTFNFGGSAIQTVSLTADDRLELNSSTNVSGVVTLTTNIDGSAELANGTFNELQNVSFSGAGDSASLGVGTINVSGAALTMSLTGLAAGFSSTDVSMASANLVIDGSNSTGKMHMENVSGTEAVTISTGSLGWFSAGDIEGSNSIVIDMSAKALASSGHLAVTDISSSGAVTVTLGASDLGASGRVALSSVTTESNFILDGTNFGGLIDVGGGSDVDVSSNMTVTLGSSGHFSSEDTISVGQDFVLDASNAVSANIQIGASAGKLSAGDSLTISLGQGSTAGLVSVVAIDGNTVTLDASNYGGNINITDTVTSGNYTVALGSLGDFSADTISAAGGNFTLDGSNATTASITMNSITATGGNLTVSLGGGSGAVSGTSMFTGGKFTLDGTSFGGAVHITNVSASGNTTISLGDVSTFSGSSVQTQGNLTIDQSAGVSAGLTIVYVSAADVVISESGGSGDLSITNVQAASDFTLDGSLSTGSQDISSISASGNVTISLNTAGDFSGSSIVAGGNITIDGAASTTADVSIGTFSATNVTVSLGAGSGDLKIGDDFTNNRVAGNFTLDATNFGGDVDITSLTASGTVTMSVGGVGNFSAGGVVNAGVSTIDLSNQASVGTTTLVSYSATSLSMTLGAGSGTVSAGLISLGDAGALTNNFVLDGLNFEGQLNIEQLSASGAITMSMGGANGISASIINSGGNLTLDNSTSTSGRVVLQDVSASGAITISYGNATGTNAFLISAIDTQSNLTINATGVNSDIDIEDISAVGNLTFVNAGTGTVAMSAVNVDGTMSLSAYLGNDGSNEETLTLNDITTSGSLSLTVTGGTGNVVASALTVGHTFTLDTSASTETTTAHDVETVSASAVAIVLGAGDDLDVSAMGVGTLGGSITMQGSAEFTTSGYFSAAGALTINHVGGGLVQISSLQAHSTLTYNATGLATSGNHVDLDTLVTSAATTFNFGDGLVANVNISAADTKGGFTFTGADLQSSTTVLNHISGDGAITIDMGGASGALTISSVKTLNTFTLDAGAAPELDIGKIHSVTASADINLTLGAVSDSTKALDVSVMDAKGAFVLNAGSYREGMDFQHISGGTVTMTFGDLTDNFSASAVFSDGAFTLNGGGGPSFSGAIANGDFGGNFTITMAEIGNGIHIGHGAGGMTISASGTIVGTLELDTISVESTTQSTDSLTFDVTLGEDSIADELSFAEGAGKDLVVVRNFVSGTDKIEYTGNSSNLGNQTLNVTAAASLIGDALGLSSDPNVSDVSVQSGATAQLGSAVWVYNGDSYYVGGDIGGDSDGVFDAGETIFRIIGVTNFGNNANDLTDI